MDRLAVESSLPLLPGAEAAVRRLAQRWPLGLASGSPRLLIDAAANAGTLAGLFDVSVSTDEVRHGKPAPDVYLAVAAQMGIDPRRCLAIEDSGAGMRSARAAGLRLIAIPQTGFPQAGDAIALADARLTSLDDVTVDLVEQLLLGS